MLLLLLFDLTRVILKLDVFSASLLSIKIKEKEKGKVEERQMSKKKTGRQRKLE